MRNQLLILHNSLFILISLVWVQSTRCFVPSSSGARQLPIIALKAMEEDTLSSTSASYLATCIPGLAHILADELAEIHPDITEISQSGNSAVTFVATREASLQALCWVRTAHRLLELVAESGEKPLYDRTDLHAFVEEQVNVKDLLGDGQGGLLTLSVKSVLNNPRQLPQDLSHSHYTALTIKNALCDVVRGLRGDRPSVDIDSPDVPLVAILLGNAGGAIVSLYRSLHPPGSLHRRGYRQGSAIHKAAMKESLAAGLLREAGWHTKIKATKKDDEARLRLIDPMCGSGTFIVEAAMIAADIAPGLMRIRCGVTDHSLPPVTRWKSDIDTTKLWKEVLHEGSLRAKNGLRWLRSDASKVKLHGNDIHPGALEIMESSLSAAGLLKLVRITNRDCYDLEIDEEDQDVPYFITTNPPWGVRLTDDIGESWEGLRHFMRDVCPSSTEAWVLSGDKAATLSLKLRRDRMIPLKTGDQNLRWIQYTIRGKKKPDEESDIENQESVEKQDKRALNSHSEAKAAPPMKKFAPPLTNKSGKKVTNEWLVN